MRRPLIPIYLFGAAFLLLGACESNDIEATPRPAATSAEKVEEDSNAGGSTGSGGSASVEVIDTDFRPVTITIEKGSTVNWEQVGDQPHSVTAVDGSFDSSPDCGPIDSDRCLGAGDKFSHVFDQTGKFIYYCRVHGLPDGTGMVGTIVVR